jgi:hypothetical protein
MDEALKRAHDRIDELDSQLRQYCRETAKLKRIVQLGRRVLHADIADCVDAELLNRMLEAEGEKAASREAEIQQGLSAQELVRRVRRQRD